MSYQIKWTDESEFTLNKNLEYLSEKWDLRTINNFLKEVDAEIDRIALNPKLYGVHNKLEKIHKCVINRHITLFYKIVSSERIDLLTFWNTHQDPIELKV